MNILKYLLAFVFAITALVVAKPLLAQQIQPEAFGIRHGLSQGYIACMLQDREGFIWAGTKNGLNRFDGRRFQVFVNDPADPFSISHDYVNTLCEYGDFLLAGTNGGGLNIFHKKTQRFYRMPDSLPGGRLDAPAVLKVTTDAQGNICLLNWKTVYDGNPYHIRLPEGFWQNLAQGKVDWSGAFMRKLSDYDASDIALSSDGQSLYYTREGNLAEIELKSGSLRLHPHPDVSHISNIFVAGQNNLWISGRKGLLQFEGRQWTLIKPGIEANWMALSPTRDYLFFAHRSFLPLTGVYRVALNRSGDFLKFGEIALVVNLPDFYTGLLDSSGNLWIGTGGFGLKKFSAQVGRFRTFFEGESVYSPPFHTDDGGYAFITSPEKPHLRTAPAGSRHPLQAFQEQFKGLDLRARYLRDPRGHHWLYYKEDSQNHLACVPASGGGPRTYLFKTGEERPGNIALDTDGSVFIGLNGVLYRFNPATEQFAEYDYRNALPLGHEMRALANTPDGRWWLGTSKGIVEARPKAAGGFDFRLWQHEPGYGNSLRNNDVASLLPDPKDPNTLWIGTKGGGLDRMNINSGQFKHLTTRDGLPNDVIYAVLPDEPGHLWLSSNKGLTRYHPETGQIKNFTEADGLQSDEFNTWAYGKTPGGELMFGGVKGLNVFRPEDITDNPHLPPVFLTGLKINNRTATPGDSTGLLSQTLEFTEEIRLLFSQNSITLEFAALEYTAPSKNRFRYYLEGAEAEWAHESSEPSAQYLNLAPGDYTFNVMACNNDGVWNPAPAMLRITVLPPWYRSWWAWFFYAIAAGGLFYLYMRFRIGQLRLQQRLALEHREVERARELDEFKSRLFTNITHEFRTPLTVVLGASEQLEKQAPESAFPDLNTANAFANGLKSRLALIRRNGRSLLDLVNQLLDLAKAESNQLKVHYLQGDMMRYTRYIAESFHSLSNQRNVLLTVDSKLPELVMDYDPEKLRQILSNLISNALKYTPSGGRVTIFVTHHSSFIILKVADTGAGIAPEDLPLIFDRFYQADNNAAKIGGTGIGLALTRELVKLLGGEISVESELGKGSIFTVRLPITQNAASPVPPGKEEASLIPSPSPEEKEAPLSPPPGGTEGAAILIIEDNPDVVDYLRLCLDGRYQLHYAYNGRAGIEQALEFVPGLILSDVMMPEKDGFEVCDFLKNDPRTSHIPVVLLTAKADVESRIAGLRRGADAYLTKPFHPEELLATLENLLDLRRKLQARYIASALSFSAQPDGEQNPVALPPADIEDVFLQKLRAAVEARLGDAGLSAEDVCRAVGMSRSNLYAKLSALTNLSFNIFVRTLRLHKAKALLETTDLNVSEAAYEVGFNDPKYFSRVFSEQFGIAPSEVKKN